MYSILSLKDSEPSWCQNLFKFNQLVPKNTTRVHLITKSFLFVFFLFKRMKRQTDQSQQTCSVSLWCRKDSVAMYALLSLSYVPTLTNGQELWVPNRSWDQRYNKVEMSFLCGLSEFLLRGRTKLTLPRGAPKPLILHTTN